MKVKKLSLYLLLLAGTTSCDDEINWNREEGNAPVDTETTGIYILCEGLYNTNNSTLSYYDFTQGKMYPRFFEKQNGRKLGDTANDLQSYGSKVWCAVDVSSQIEVLDIRNGKSIRQIPLFTESGIARQPRHFAFYKEKAYVCNFDGTVARIDTATLTVEGFVKVGRNPDGICVSNGKLYVSNSGGLNTGNPDNTVSVIDLAGFTEIKKIPLRENPGAIHADRSGNIYVVSRGKYSEEAADYDCKLHRIDNETDKVIFTYDHPVLDFCIAGHTAYMYSYNKKQQSIQVMDTRTGEITDSDFVKGDISISCIYNIAVNPANGDVYVCDAQDYKVDGSVLCFDKEGKHKFTLRPQGINPNSVVFTNAVITSGEDEPGNTTDRNNPITQVLEYVPAPGQFVGEIPLYEAGDDSESMCRKCLEYFNKNYSVSLGGFGGYITVGFDRTIPNVPGEYDFKILGNAFEGSAEPGIVLVSRDSNRNGLPDDEWYELKGSEYDRPDCIRNYEITYYKPANDTDPVRWTDNQGKEGIIPHTGHPHSYYPAWIDAPTLTFRGTRLPDNGYYDDEKKKWVMAAYAYGYADNRPNNSDGCKFNLDWAVDDSGIPVRLEGIDFIRIYTAVNQQIAGGVGELSTEILGIEDLHSQK